MTIQDIIIMLVIAQSISFSLTFVFIPLKEKLSKVKIIQLKEQAILAEILEEETDIEIDWILTRTAEKKIEGFKEQIKHNLEEMEIEKAKTPMSLEKIQVLIKENGALGYTGKIVDGQEVYEKNSKIGSVENEVNHYQSKIVKAVTKREYLKVQLRALRKMIKRGAVKNFDRFEEEELSKKIKI